MCGNKKPRPKNQFKCDSCSEKDVDRFSYQEEPVDTSVRKPYKPKVPW